MDHVKEYCRSPSMLEQGWKSVRTQGEMEDCLCLHLVDNMEEEEAEVFENKSIPFPSQKMNCLVTFYFWCIHTLPKELGDITQILDSL